MPCTLARDHPGPLLLRMAHVASGRQPFAIARADGAPLSFAGLWESFKWPDGDILRTFEIITTDANALMRPVHDRMPVVLEEAEWPIWMDGRKAPICFPPSGR